MNQGFGRPMGPRPGGPRPGGPRPGGPNRFFGGGFLVPFILGGITGGLIAPVFNRPVYYQPYPMYPPYYRPY